MLELDRIILTRLRTGSHNLRIESGRHHNLERAQQICKYNLEIQTLRHIIFDCVLLIDMRINPTYTTLEEFFQWNGAAMYIMNAAKILKVKV